MSNENKLQMEKDLSVHAKRMEEDDEYWWAMAYPDLEKCVQALTWFKGLCDTYGRDFDEEVDHLKDMA